MAVKRDTVPGMGELLRQARKDAGLTTVQVQESTGIPAGNLSLYENDKKTPSVAILRRLAQCYEVDPGKLIPPIDPA